MVVMMMHVAMRRKGAPTQTTTCSMIICERKKTRLTTPCLKKLGHSGDWGRLVEVGDDDDDDDDVEDDDDGWR